MSEAVANNPLLDFSGFPRFDAIGADHVAPAIEHLIAQAQSVLAHVTSDDCAATWDAVAGPLDEATEKLSRAWGIVNHLHSVVDTPALRDAYNAQLPAITEFWTQLGQDERLYAKYKSIAQSPEFSGFSAARKKVIDNALRDFRLGGAELPKDQKLRYSEIQERQAALSARFSENVLDATNAYKHTVTDPAELAGLPEDAIEAARLAAEKNGVEGHLFTLHFPSYFPVLQYAENRGLRERMYQASAQRASEFGPEALDNTSLMKELLQLRQEEARMLGFQHFAELSLVPKMADTPEQVVQFLRDLARRARPYAQKDWDELQRFAKEHLGLEELKAWDTTYASEKLREHRYAFSDNEVKQYFQEPAVLKGLFNVIQTLFSVQIDADEAPVWHPHARFFTVRQNGKAIAHFYLDPYAREHKRGGAWMDDARGRKVRADGIQTPIAYLTCNFPAPVGDKPATLSHDDVITLFHEFGHGLHHMLTQVDELGVAGINGVEWDAVELPSQFMENFAWEWSVVENMTAHIQTGESLPRALFDKMVAAKNFQSGLQTLRQIEFSLFDMQLHSAFDPHGDRSVLDLLETVRDEVALIRPPAYNRFPNTFTHIFAGGYAAGYYSYKWAEVLSADAFAQFEENGVFNPETGQKFWKEILSAGGARPAAENFRAFRGRDPQIDALLRHNGMQDSPLAA